MEKNYTEIELPLEPLLYRIELAGMKVNEAALKGFSDFVSTELETLREKIYAIGGDSASSKSRLAQTGRRSFVEREHRGNEKNRYGTDFDEQRHPS